MTFTISDHSPNGITIQCVQSGGQQFGELSIYSYALYSMETDWYEEVSRDFLMEPIAMNDTTTILLDWTQEFPSLAPGSYGIRLYIQDTYTPEDVPPLSRNYHDSQGYDLFFTIE